MTVFAVWYFHKTGILLKKRSVCVILTENRDDIQVFYAFKKSFALRAKTVGAFWYQKRKFYC